MEFNWLTLLQLIVPLLTYLFGRVQEPPRAVKYVQSKLRKELDK